MAKRITIGEAEIEELRKDFEEKLKSIKSSNGKFTYEKNLGTINQKAKVCFEEETYLKMKMLIATTDKEVGWHCLARKIDPEEGYASEYEVYDIMVYPQSVTGATVNTDKEEFEKWLYERSDDEFNNMRFHGHSHVNMGVSPSSVDKGMYEDWLDDLQQGMANQFYIFSIWNKKGEIWMNIYDLDENVLYENGDIDVRYTYTPGGVLDFIDEAKNMVTTKVYQPKSYKNNVTYVDSNGYPDDEEYYNKWSKNYGAGKFYPASYPDWD